MGYAESGGDTGLNKWPEYWCKSKTRARAEDRITRNCKNSTKSSGDLRWPDPCEPWLLAVTRTKGIFPVEQQN